jgi:hypothetical protein
MPTAEARVPTARASRYLVQLCRHADQMGGHRMTRLPAHMVRDSRARHDIPARIVAEWSDTHGTVRFDDGTCTLRATSDTLILHLDADTADTLQRMQGLITGNLTRFSRRDPLTVTWNQLDETDGTPADEHAPPATGQPRRRHRTIVLVVIAALAIAAHLVLGGAVLAAPQWTGLATDVILAVVVIKIAIIGLGYLGHRRRKATKSR